MMKYAAGFLTATCAWLVFLRPSVAVAHAPRRHAALSCRPKDLTAFATSRVEATLESYNEANGNHLGNSSISFPDLRVNENTSLVPSQVQCCLHFIHHALEKILQDQKDDLNPMVVSLHEKLEETIFQINMLTKCMKHVLGGECTAKLPPPKMPTPAFERKQWSHALLKTSRDYLRWLGHKVADFVSKVKGTTTGRPKYLGGSEHFL